MRTPSEAGFAFGQRLTPGELKSGSSINPMKRKTPKARGSAKIVFLFDVDNTLLDNDGVIADLKRHLEKEVGREGAQCYWSHLRTIAE